MKPILSTLLISTGLAMAFAAPAARAADIAATPACSIAGIVDAGLGYQGGNVTNVGPNSTMSGNLQKFGDIAIGYGCDSWFAQIDGSIYNQSFSNNGAAPLDAQHTQGHVGGALFWREASVGRFGIAGSEIFNTMHLNGLIGPAGSNDIGGSLTRIGAFGDFYASDSITLGGGAFYISGAPITTAGTYAPQTGFEGNLHAKFYATDNISFTLQGDVLKSTITSRGIDFPLSGIAGSAEAEYLIPDSAISLFAGGRIANRTLDNSGAGGPQSGVNDTQGYLGVKWAFGGPVQSLRARDRAGTYDNASVFDEKLPGIFYDSFNAQSH